MTYKVKSASQAELFSHLKNSDDCFDPPLSTRVELLDYAKKIFDRSVTFEAWEKEILVGVISAYFNDAENRLGYITHVGVLKSHRRRGIAARLFSLCMEYARERHFSMIELEVSKKNERAVALYQKAGFQVSARKNGSLVMRQELRQTA